MSTVGELACIYAALILHDDGIAVTEEKIATAVKAANVEVEAYWPGLFAKMLQKTNVQDLIMNVGSGGGGAPVVVSAPSGGAAPAALPAEEEEEEDGESDYDIGIDIFGGM